MNNAPKTTRELMNLILKVLPTASFDTDNLGQIVIYTGLAEDDDDDTLTELERA